LPYIEDSFPDGHYYYYQDNSPIHKSRVVRQWFQLNVPEYQLFDTPAKSFDMNPIENVWGRSKVKVAKNGIFEDLEDLWESIFECWNAMREDIYYSHNLVDSMPNRLQSIINANEGHIKY
jgi:hypothetical protein